MPKLKLFNPILAGATLQERLIGCAGALLGICVTALTCGYVFGTPEHFPLIVAPIGASAVLLFAVPASPLAQPWPIVGGNTISALVGVTVAHYVGNPMLAVGLAVGLAILAMSLTRSLHPPGGAAALTAVIGGPAVVSAGFWFPFVPVAINSVILVLLGLVFHRLAKRNYPHRPAPVANTHKTADVPPAMRVGFNKQDIDAALSEFNETLDIDREDLDRILRTVEAKALNRAHAELVCADIMSRDVVSVSAEDGPATARRLLLEHDIRTLPVLNGERRLVGTVGLRELAGLPDDAPMPMSRAATASPDAPAVSLLPSLTDGRNHAVVVVGENHAVAGIVSQTDLLAALAKSLSVVRRPDEVMLDGRGI
ncbi:HPP family protein [Rhizobium sp. TH2]|uniref:HPP family protein n=1 Tax=Rhizobium sp. TH2 TaxID=2775403 RepID=UPI002156FB18|nr:HPP family protein [Rhizobium sp. TH2]UVC08070.1 HPP family protein [Rhizobium sp. TH2]